MLSKSLRIILDQSPFLIPSFIVGMFGIFYPLTIDCKTAITWIPNGCEYEKIILTMILLIPMLYLGVRAAFPTNDKIVQPSMKDDLA